VKTKASSSYQKKFICLLEANFRDLPVCKFLNFAAKIGSGNHLKKKVRRVHDQDHIVNQGEQIIGRKKSQTPYTKRLFAKQKSSSSVIDSETKNQT